MPYRMLSQRTVAIIGLVVAINIIVLSFGLKFGLTFRPAPLFGFGKPQAAAPSETAAYNHSSPALTGQDPGFPEEEEDNEKWRLDPANYVLERAWDLNASPTTRTYNLTITRGKAWPDGVVRDVLLVNGKFPGPLIRANRGDTVLVNVTNNLAHEPTAIHWHGIHQRGTPYSDGSVGISQCPIPPGRSLVYNFTLDGQSGTFWWHAHHHAQAMDGIFGPMVVHAPEESKAATDQYDEDRVVVLQDWYHDPSEVNMARYLAPAVENDEPIPDNGLINGLNYFDCSLYAPEDNRTCHQLASRQSFTLKKGAKTRLRLINAGAFAGFEFSVDEHPLSIIEADGTMIRPHTVRRVPIHAGQRYSVVLDTNQTTASTYWIRSKMISHCFSGDENPVLDVTTKAVLRYDGADQAATATSRDWPDAMAVICEDPEPGTLVPLISRPPPPATRFVAVDFHFAIGANQMSFAKINETVTWNPLVNSTTLLDATTGLRSPQAAAWAADGRVDAFPEDQYVIGVSSANASEVVDLLIYSLDDGSHPLHLHGHDFWIMATGNSGFEWDRYYSDLMHSTAPATADALRRDTVTIRPYAWVLIRFVADNPGLWALHCQMAWHMEAGLLMQFMSGAQALKTMHIPDDMAGLCLDSRPG